jgi:hypothetical protein
MVASISGGEHQFPRRIVAQIDTLALSGKTRQAYT